jgi:Domain of unknown function (DUF4267)
LLLEASSRKKREWRFIALAALAGVILTVIGIRFLLWPEAAAKLFGIEPRPQGLQLHHIVGLRDLWLGLLAVGLVYLREWRALGLWFALGTFVCFGDAAIVWLSAGKPAAIAFHLCSGVFCAGMAGLLLRSSHPREPADIVK